MGGTAFTASETDDADSDIIIEDMKSAKIAGVIGKEHSLPHLGKTKGLSIMEKADLR